MKPCVRHDYRKMEKKNGPHSAARKPHASEAMLAQPLIKILNERLN